MLRANIFGGLRLVLDGAEVDIVGAQRRRLVSLLLASSPESVGVSRLIQCLDPDARSSNPKNVVQAHIRRLRRSLDPGLAGRDCVHLRSVGDGYALVPDSMDLWDFRQLMFRASSLRRIDPARAVDLQSEALAMFSAPWGEPGEDPLLRDAAISVRTEKLAVRDDWMATLLEAGLAATAADEMIAAVRREPTRERRCVYTMHALYRAGRQADALRLHEEIRIVLRDELGVSPGEAMEEMHARVLAHDPTLLARHTTVDGRIARDSTSFVGRKSELGAISDLLGRHRVVTVCGLAGVGKSRLVREWLERDCTMARALWVSVPVAIDGANESDVTGALSDALGLGESDEQSHQDERWASVRASLPHEPGLVVVDGAESCLDDTAHVVLRICAARPALRVLVTSQVPLAISGEQVLLLKPLPMPVDGVGIEGSAVQLAKDRMGPGIGLAAAIELSERCGGLPLALEMMAGTLEAVVDGTAELAEPEDPAGRPPRDGNRSDPPDPAEILSKVVDSAAAHLSPRARELLRLSCALPAGISMDAAEWVCGRDRAWNVEDPFEHRRVMGELVRSSLLRSTPARTGVRFVAPEQISRLVTSTMSAGTRDDAARANVDYLLSALEARRPRQALRADPRCRELLTDESPNVVAAQRYLADRNPDALAELLIALVTHRRQSNEKHRIKRWVEQLRSERPTDGNADPRLIICSAMLEPDLAAVGRRRADIELAGRIINSGDLRGSGWSMAVAVLLAVATGWNGELGLAWDHMSEAKRLADGKPWEDAAVDRYRSLLIFADGLPDEAVKLAEESADRLEELGDPDEALGALYFAITIARTACRGELRPLVERASHLIGASETSYSPLIMAEQARCAQEDGDPGAMNLLAEAAAALEAAGLLRTAATTRRDLGLMHLAEGNVQRGERELLQSAEALLRLDPMGSALAIAGLAVCQAPRSRGPSADLARIAWALTRTSGTPLSSAEQLQLEDLIGVPMSNTQTGQTGDSTIIDHGLRLLDGYSTGSGT
ncbi:MAG: BTAD domain-containing putative transcriptional regulator [Microthrixaceae bacterium]